MTLEEVKNELKVFNKFTFFEEDHHYECNGKKVGISVTRLIEEYSNPFDQQAIAEKVAEKNLKNYNYAKQQLKIYYDYKSSDELKELKKMLTKPINVIDVLQEWEYKNKFACEKGSTCHEYAQSIWSGEEYNELLFDGSIEYLTAVNKIQAQAMNFWKDFKNEFIHIKDEQLVGSEEYDICSAIDHLFLDKKGNIWLIDYKTNSILKGYNDDEKNRRYTKKMLIPLQNLKDDALHHYYLQLSIYKYLIEKYTNIKIYKTMIVYMSENIENYGLIETPYLENEAKLILKNRRVKNMNSVPVLLIGASGTGKSTSLRNFTRDEVAVINILGKPLPFKSDIKAPKLDDYASILKAISGTKKKTIVIDDANYLITNEFMNKSSIKGFDKYNEIGSHFFELINGIKNIEGGKTVYLIMHEDTDENGNIKPKTIGKLLDDKINIQGMFTICIRSMFENGNYIFRLKTNGQDCVKTPFGMFEEEQMENDLKEFDKIVREYYELDKIEEEGEEK